MAEEDTQQGDAQSGTIPVERWISHPVSDHSDLDRPAPLYVEGLTANERAEFEQGLVAKKKQAEADAAAAQEKPKPGEKKQQPPSQ